MYGNADRRNSRAAATFREAVIFTAAELGEKGLDLVIEPINERDMPGYFLNDFPFAERLIRDLAIAVRDRNAKIDFRPNTPDEVYQDKSGHYPRAYPYSSPATRNGGNLVLIDHFGACNSDFTSTSSSLTLAPASFAMSS